MFEHSRHKYIDFAKIYHKVGTVYRDLPPVKARRRTRARARVFKFAVILVLTFLLIAIMAVASQGMRLKALYGQAMTGKDRIDEAVAAWELGQFELCSDQSRQAGDHFSQAAEILTSISQSHISRFAPLLKKQIDDLLFLMEAASMLSQALSGAADIADSFQDLMMNGQSYTSLSTAEKAAVLDLLYRKSPELAEVRSDLKLAEARLAKISWQGLLYPFQKRFAGLNARLAMASKTLDTAVPMSQILPALLGYPDESHFLFILHNNDELRPTGGFIGTYGIVRTKDGEIERFETHDIYHMDMPVKDLVNIEPPEPLRKYLGVEKWYMRDSNWSPHWPEAAEKIMEFYRIENALLPPRDQINNFEGDFDAVIGITPDLIIDLLKITGPIEIEGESYTPDNFLELLQYRVEMGFVQLGIPSWHRKEVIGDIAAEMKKRLLDLSLPEIFPVMERVGRHLQEKNVIIYSRDEAIQEILALNNWWGGLRQVDHDYLLIVDANMAALKTDAVMERRVDYRLEPHADGLAADLKIRYAHNGGFDWRTTRYRTFLRIYVPAGSILISGSGHSDGQISTSAELGKTVFSAFVSVEPGQRGELSLKYLLPPPLSRQMMEDGYRLLVQRQPGNNVGDLNVSLALPGEILSYEPVSFFAAQSAPNRIDWHNPLNNDILYRVEMK